MLTLQACAVTTTGTNFPPGGGLDGPSIQAPSSFSSSSHLYPHPPSRHSFRHHNQTSVTNWNSALSQQQQLERPQPPQLPQQQPQQQRQSRKRAHEDNAPSQQQADSETAALQEHRASSSTAGSAETSLQCPRLQTQQLCLPRKRSQSLGVSMQGSNNVAQCQLDPNAVKANFVDCLVGECL
ncbi:hypothetical protein EDD21DRAFT_414017 [Dissophora ornata]|nr:hypothetical protein EDD21DRAFT_414017 [Dissophora ornata]